MKLATLLPRFWLQYLLLFLQNIAAASRYGLTLLLEVKPSSEPMYAMVKAGMYAALIWMLLHGFQALVPTADIDHLCLQTIAWPIVQPQLGEGGGSSFANLLSYIEATSKAHTPTYHSLPHPISP